MNNTIKRPATVRELGEWCEQNEKTILEGLEFFSPWPAAPDGYTVDPKSDDRWLGPEQYHEKWIITPVWNATRDTHSFDVWLADHQPPHHTEISPEQALELSQTLINIVNADRSTGVTTGEDAGK